MEVCLGIIYIVDMVQEQIVGSFSWREEDGAIAFEVVCIAKELGMVLPDTWKGCWHLLEYLAINLKKILISSIGTE
uniref:Uncharacterized protein MANES_09G182100 n=1 Tax=Rhizophora mucronata TaxID=61149 RepID=A0A2P2QLS2_RHIMU